MSIFNNQNYINSPKNYSPLNNDNTQEPNIKKVNISLDENGYYIIYKTPYGFRQIMEFSCLIISIIFGILFSVYFIIFSDSNQRYLSLILPLLFCFIGFSCNSIHYILLDPSQKRIILKKEKMFDCISKCQIIQINDIKKIILEKNGNNPEEDRFKIYFKLVNDKKVIAIDTYDEKGEGSRALKTLKYFLS